METQQRPLDPYNYEGGYSRTKERDKGSNGEDSFFFECTFMESNYHTTGDGDPAKTWGSLLSVKGSSLSSIILSHYICISVL